MSQTWFKPVSNLFQTCPKPVSNLSQTCTWFKPVSNLFQACLKPVPKLSKTCIIVPKPCHNPVPNLLQNGLKPVSHVLLFPSLPSVFIVELKASFPVSEDFKLSGEFFAVIFISCLSYKTFYSSPLNVWHRHKVSHLIWSNTWQYLVILGNTWRYLVIFGDNGNTWQYFYTA